MTLSFLLILLIPIIVVPALVLPHNKINFGIFSLLYALSIPIAFSFINIVYPNFEVDLGLSTYPMFSWIISGYKELNIKERAHISFILFLFMIFFFIFIITFTIQNTFLLGQNPSIHTTRKKFYRIFQSTVFFSLAYFSLAYFLISIREILSIQDGFLSSLFSLIYKIEV